MPIDIDRRNSFDQIAQAYDTIRPSYPEALFDDIIARAGLGVGARLLEVGCGTGLATRPFARRGYPLLCLDIGAEMLAVARASCRDYPNVQFQQSAFEDWPADGERFRLIYSATAWHWVPPEIGYAKAAGLLQPDGWLAIFRHLYPDDQPSAFFQATQVVYNEVVPEWPSFVPTEQEISKQTQAITQSGYFKDLSVLKYRWTQSYTREQYIRLIDTYSDHRTLPDKQRARLYQGLGDLIDRECGGQIERPYLAVLYLAQARAAG